MISQAERIQALITEIDRVLEPASSEGSGPASIEATLHRPVLEKVRRYLVAQQSATTLGSPSNFPTPTTDPLLQGSIQQIAALHTRLIQPLQADLETLHRKSQKLIEDLETLEVRQPSPSASAHPTLNPASMETDAGLENLNLLDSQNQESPTDATAPLHLAQRLESLHRLQAETDRVLVNLDATLKIVFDSLQGNIRGYQTSLSEGLERMHNLGQQGEVLLAAWVNQLADRLENATAVTQRSSSPQPSPPPESPPSQLDPAATESPAPPSTSSLPSAPTPPEIETLINLEPEGETSSRDLDTALDVLNLGRSESRSEPSPHEPAEIDSNFNAAAGSAGIDTITTLRDLIPDAVSAQTTPERKAVFPTEESQSLNPEAPIEDSDLRARPDRNLRSAGSDETPLEQGQHLQILKVSPLHQLEDPQEQTQTGVENSKSSARVDEPSDEELDAIFPAFLLEENLEETEELSRVPPLSGAASEPSSSKTQKQGVWYLGLDFGTTGISAALLNRLTGTLYPIYWLKPDPPNPPARIFRLPCVVSPMGEGNTDEIVAVGFEAIDFARAEAELGGDSSGWLLQNFKSALKLGLPWHDDQGQPQPLLQWSHGQTLPLAELQQALQALLVTLKQGALACDRTIKSDGSGMEAIPISPFPPPSVSQALQELEGVMMNVPFPCPEAYRFNLREAVLKAQLVQRPEQVVFVEEAIATVLSALPGETLSGSPEPGWQFSPDWRGTTLAINAGAMATELVLVDFPPHLTELTHDRFKLHSFSYGGNALDQDIISQLLLGERLPPELASMEHWPQPGESDIAKRTAFGQWLQSSPLRRSLLEVARELKLRLQEQSQLSVELGSRPVTVRRRDLEIRVLVPYVKRLNRELNRLLSQTGVAVEGIHQALCTGGNASWEAIARWLRQKLPNATIVQDVYPGDRPPGCSRVAWGLATLPLYPHILEEQPQQYSDYFLLRELIQTFSQRPLSVGELMALMECRGINIRSCQPRILEFLAGQLPPGLVPSGLEASLIAESSRQHPVYRELLAASFFFEEADRTYRPNPQKLECLLQYLRQVTAEAEQALEEPLAVSLGVVRVPSTQRPSLVTEVGATWGADQYDRSIV